MPPTSKKQASKRQRTPDLSETDLSSTSRSLKRRRRSSPESTVASNRTFNNNNNNNAEDEYSKDTLEYIDKLSAHLITANEEGSFLDSMGLSKVANNKLTIKFGVRSEGGAKIKKKDLNDVANTKTYLYFMKKQFFLDRQKVLNIIGRLRGRITEQCTVLGHIFTTPESAKRLIEVLRCYFIILCDLGNAYQRDLLVRIPEIENSIVANLAVLMNNYTFNSTSNGFNVAVPVNQTRIIYIDNTFDYSSPFGDFEYTEVILNQTGKVIPSAGPKDGCQCNNCDNRNNCCPQKHSGGIIAYDRQNPGILTQRMIGIAKNMRIIYECNSQCKCISSKICACIKDCACEKRKDCVNRVVQKADSYNLTIYKDKNKGWCVKTNIDLQKGQYICQYVGDLLNSDKADEAADTTGATYLFNLNKGNYSIDAMKHGSFSRFFNHSCDPNMAVYNVFIECRDKDLPTLAFFTIKPIVKNTELTFNYIPAEQTGEAKPCYCGADNCRQII